MFWPNLILTDSFDHNVADSRLLSLAKLRRVSRLPPIAFLDGPALPDDWQPDPRLEAVLGRLRSNDTGLVALDLSGSPADDGDFLALALAAALVGNTTLASLQLRSCGIGDLGLRSLARLLSGNTAIETLE